MREPDFARRKISSQIATAETIFSAILDTDGEILVVNEPWEARTRKSSGRQGFPPVGSGLTGDEFVCLGLEHDDSQAVQRALRDILDGHREEWALEHLDGATEELAISAVYLLSIDFPDGLRGALLAMPAYDAVLGNVSDAVAASANAINVGNGRADLNTNNSAAGSCELRGVRGGPTMRGDAANGRRAKTSCDGASEATHDLVEEGFESDIRQTAAVMNHILRLNAGQGIVDDLEMVLISASDVIDAVKDKFSKRAKTKNIQLLVNRPRSDVLLEARPESLRCGLCDVLRSVIDVCKEDSRVMLSVRRGRQFVVFEVRYGWPAFNNEASSSPSTENHAKRGKIRTPFAKALCELEGWNLSFDHDDILGGTVAIKVSLYCVRTNLVGLTAQ